ncbi:hypothetical protein OROGR_023381 [Orobanche gracilis]
MDVEMEVGAVGQTRYHFVDCGQMASDMDIDDNVLDEIGEEDRTGPTQRCQPCFGDLVQSAPFNEFKLFMDKRVATPTEMAEYFFNYTLDTLGSKSLDTTRLETSMTGNNVKGYSLKVVPENNISKKKKLLFETKKGSENKILAKIYNILVLTDRIDNTETPEENFEGDIRSAISKMMTLEEEDSLPQKMKQKEPAAKKRKGEEVKSDVIENRVRVIPQRIYSKMEKWSRDFIVDIDFASDARLKEEKAKGFKRNITQKNNLVQYYYMENTFAKIFNLDADLKKDFEIQVVHGWKPEDSVSFPPQKRSLELIFEKNDKAGENKFAEFYRRNPVDDTRDVRHKAKDKERRIFHIVSNVLKGARRV